MTNYAPLVAVWPSLTGTTDQKLAQINSMTSVGPMADVSVPQVVGFMLLSGAYLPGSKFAQGAVTGNGVHDAALLAMQTLMAVITVPNAPGLNMSNPTVYAEIKGMADAVLAQETATPGSTGFTQTVHDGLLALAATTVPWWQANGFTSMFDSGDLAAAGGLT